MSQLDGTGPPPQIRSYHGQPLIKEPIWSWEIPCYFFSGGVGGASAGLAYLLQLRGDEPAARRAWTTALAAIGISTGLLISDLGRPARFFNMLRTFKITSPMSVGSWILAGSGTATAVAALNSCTGVLPRTARLAKPTAAILGLPLSTYTGALVANTAVPVWHESRRLMPFVFGSGAALSAGAIGVSVIPPAQARAARRLALGAAAVEGPLMELLAHRTGEHGEVYRHGTAAKLANLSRACVVGGSALLYRRGGSSRVAATLAGAILSVGGLATRWCIFEAGFASARDPKYVVGPQRRAIERGERRGGARRPPRVATGDPALGSPATLV